MIEVLVPRENVNDESVIISAVHCSSGVVVKKGDVVVSIETSKTNIDIASEHAGVINHKLEVGHEIDVGALLFTIGDQQFLKQSSNLTDSILVDDKKNIAAAKFSDAAKKRAQELGVSLNQFSVGWISSADIEELAGIKKPLHKAQLPELITSKNNLTIDVSLPVKEFPLSKRKQAEVKSLQIGHHESTTSVIGIQVQVPGERVVKPSYLFKDSISDLIVFEGARLLRQYPELNAFYKNEKTWGSYQEVNFGWSFDNGKNLKVLAIKHADQLTLSKLHDEVERLLNLYESGDSIPNQLLLDSTVTLSDLSRSDASYMLPLINGYQSLILGVVRKAKNVFELYASFDHRVSEGLSVTNFLSELKKRILSYYFLNDGIANIVCYGCGKSMSDELDLGYRGFTKVTLANGCDDNLCRNCFEGW
jgi:pyruvate/2-oxoglutarate dehydrogenase complex dihydrolipoamide acyltransferase (E2) component